MLPPNAVITEGKVKSTYLKSAYLRSIVDRIARFNLGMVLSPPLLLWCGSTDVVIAESD